MSTLKVTNIQATGETASRAVSGVAAAFERHDDNHTVIQSNNVSSITDNAAGDTTVAYTNGFAAADQSVFASSGNENASVGLVNTIQYNEASSSAKHRLLTTNASFTATDRKLTNSIACGDLA